MLEDKGERNPALCVSMYNGKPDKLFGATVLRTAYDCGYLVSGSLFSIDSLILYGGIAEEGYAAKNLYGMGVLHAYHRRGASLGACLR